MVLRRIFGCSHGTWKKIRNCRSLNIINKLPEYFAPSVSVTKKIKKLIRSYEFGNKVPYVRAMAKFRLKNVYIKVFGMFCFCFCCNSSSFIFYFVF